MDGTDFQVWPHMLLVSYALLIWVDGGGDGSQRAMECNNALNMFTDISELENSVNTVMSYFINEKKNNSQSSPYHSTDIDAAKMCHRQTVGWDTQTDQTDSPYPSNIFLTGEGIIYRQTILKCWNHTTQYGLTDNDRHRFWSWQVSTLPPNNVCSCFRPNASSHCF